MRVMAPQILNAVRRRCYSTYCCCCYSCTSLLLLLLQVPPKKGSLISDLIHTTRIGWDEEWGNEGHY